MTLQNLVYMILFVILFGSLALGAANKLNAAIIKQGTRDFTSLNELIDDVVKKKDIGTTLGMPFFMEKDSAVVFFKSDEVYFEFTEQLEIIAGESTVSTNPSYKIKKPDREGNILCLCRELENVKIDSKKSSEYLCSDSICYEIKDVNILFSVTDCKTRNYDCVDKNGDRILLNGFDIVSKYAKEGQDIFVKKTDGKTVTILREIK